MIDESGGMSEFPQGPMTIEFRQDQTYTTELPGIISDGTWEVDSAFSALTLFGHSLNGVELQDRPVQLNEILTLNQRAFRYTFDDPTTGMTLLFEFKSD